MESRTEATQRAIDTVVVRVRIALHALRAAERDLQAATADHPCESEEKHQAYNIAFDTWMFALAAFRTTTDIGLEVIEALGDGWDEYNHALRDDVEVE